LVSAAGGKAGECTKKKKVYRRRLGFFFSPGVFF